MTTFGIFSSISPNKIKQIGTCETREKAEYLINMLSKGNRHPGHGTTPIGYFMKPLVKDVFTKKG